MLSYTLLKASVSQLLENKKFISFMVTCWKGLELTKDHFVLGYYSAGQNNAAKLSKRKCETGLKTPNLHDS